MKFTILMLSLALLLGGVISVQADNHPSENLSSAVVEAEAPYIQYLSRAHQGIVIERADGSDTHILAEGMITADYSVDLTPGWSADGQWLAFTSLFMDGSEEARYYATTSPDSYFQKQGYVYHVTGKPSHALDAFSSVYDLHWVTDAPNLLIVGGWLPQEVDGELIDQPVYVLVDVEAETIKQQIEVTPYTTSLEIGDSLAIFQYAWRGAPLKDVSLIIFQTDGTIIEQATTNYVHVLELNNTELIVANQGNVYVLAEDGTRTYLVEDGSFGGSLAYAVRHGEHIFFANKRLWHWYNGEVQQFGAVGDFSHLIEDKAFANQVLVNISGQDLMLYDFTTNETTAIGEPTTAVRWSQSGRYILMWYDLDNFTQELHLYDTETGETTQLTDNGLPVWGNDYDYEWADSQVEWFSPQDDRLIYATWDSFVLRDLATGQETSLYFERNLTKDYVEFGNWERANPLGIYWPDNDTVWIEQLEYEYDARLDSYVPNRKAYQVDWTTQTVLRTVDNIEFTDTERVVYRPADSFNLQSFYWEESDQSSTMASYAWMRDAAMMQFKTFIPEDDWLLIESNTIWPDDFAVPYYRITNGDISRELTAYCLDGNCATWVPPQVDVPQIPSLATALQTEFMVTVSENILGLAWNPDGTQLAVLWGNPISQQPAGKHHLLTIWDVATQTEVKNYLLPEAVHMGGLLWNEQGLFVGGYVFSWAMLTEDYEFRLYHIDGDTVQPYPLEIVDQISLYIGDDLAVRIYEQGIIYIEHTILVGDAMAYTNPHDLAEPTREILYSTSDGQVLYLASDSPEVNILAMYNMTTGGSLGIYANPDLLYPNQKYFAVSADENYVAIGTFHNPLQIYANHERIAGDDYYPWALSFHPVQNNKLAIGVGQRVEIVTISAMEN